MKTTLLLPLLFCAGVVSAAPASDFATPPARYHTKLRAPDPAGFSGTVQVDLDVEINAYGFVTRAEVRTATDAALGEYCAEAVRHWRYAPAREYGQPVPARFIQPVRFLGGRLQPSAAQPVPPRP